MVLAHTVEELEINLLLEAVYQLFGNDFREYASAPIREKLTGFIKESEIGTISALQDRVIHDPATAKALLGRLSFRPIDLFDDAAAFHSLRDLVEPLLRSYTHPKVWIPECSTPEEVFSLAILLEEAGIHDRTVIHATCSNMELLTQVKAGCFDLNRISEYEANYVRSGGKATFSRYWKKRKGQGMFKPELARNITWSQYNLATDTSFNEFQLIICRKRLNEFGMTLRQRILSLFGDSLARFGILFTDPVDEFETMPFSKNYHVLSRQHGIYRRTYQVNSVDRFDMHLV